MIVATDQLSAQGRAARNRAIARLRAALAAHAAVQAKWAHAPHHPGSSADREQLAAYNELNNARAAFTPQFGRYELPEDLRASKWEGLT